MIIYNQSKTQILESYDADLGYLKRDDVASDEEGRNVYIFVPYTQEQIDENIIIELRRDREEQCFPIINRGILWYNELTAEQLDELEKWYKDWLDVTITKIIPEKPSWIK